MNASRFFTLMALLACLVPARAQGLFGAPPKDIVKVSVSVARHSGKTEALVTLRIKKLYHLHANPASESYLIPTTVTIAPLKGVRIGKPVYPKGELLKFGFSDKPLRVYEGTTTIRVPLTISPGANVKALKGRVRYQACNDRQCLSPATINFSFSSGAAVPAAAVPGRRARRAGFSR